MAAVEFEPKIICARLAAGGILLSCGEKPLKSTSAIFPIRGKTCSISSVGRCTFC
jgi:hypothetical protein